MKKRIILLIAVILVIAMLVTVAVSVFSFINTFQAETVETLKGDVNAMEMALGEDMDYQGFVEEFSKAYGRKERISIISEGGDLLADSEIDIATADDHSNRPEITEAGSQEYGMAVRESEHTNIRSTYVAKQMDNGIILRLSLPTATAWQLMGSGMPVIIITFAILIIVALVFANLLTRNIFAPFSQLHRSVMNYMDGEATTISIESRYDELKKISQAFENLSQRLNKYIFRAKQENKKSALIMDSINEGLMVLDKDQDVLLINKAAREIFGAGEDITDVNILHFVKRTDILKKLDKSLEQRKNMVFDVEDESAGKVYRYSTSIVKEEDAFNNDGGGMLVMIQDVTNISHLERVRQDFIANVSHELKTPLTSILGYSSIIEDGKAENMDEAKTYAGNISMATNKMIGIIDDTIQLSELDKLPQDEQTELIDIGATVLRAGKILQGQLENKNIKINVEGGARMTANPRRINQLLLNVIGNAVKYSDEGGVVNVKLSEDADYATVEVSDKGLGIPADELPRIFERFYRARNSEEITGTGLGLSIAKHITLMYGGEITAASEDGGLTTFTVKLKRSGKAA